MIDPLIARLLRLSRRATAFGHLGWAARLSERAAIEVRETRLRIWLSERGRLGEQRDEAKTQEPPMNNDKLLKCRVDGGADCPGGSAMCGFICEGHFPERAEAMNIERITRARTVAEQMAGRE